MRYVLSALFIATIICGYAVYAKWVDIPPQWNPWAPLEVDAPPNWLTTFKLQRLSRDPALCQIALTSTTLSYTNIPDRDANRGCGWRDAVRVSAIPTQFSSPFTLSCTSTVALVMWERHVLQPAAIEHFGKPITRIDHLGSYACRNVGGGTTEGGRRSEHASANALDIAGFRFDDGRRIRVATDWSSESSEGQFLRQVHAGACRFFTGVLGPDYNAAHRDHFHLDRGPFRVCR